ncbi:MAG TPA: hypothetical protein VMV82_00155 [Candidatus Dormibacteraeota bacterium]|nr:hypothetical protein [Candidatus Dormibacteraeota bacterium]
MARAMHRYVLAVPVLVAIAFAASVLPAVPALRQDWSPYPFGVPAGALFASISGWSPTGIGAPTVYDTGYLLAAVLALLRLVFPPEGLLVLFMLGVGLLCAFGGRAIAKQYTGNELTASAAALALTFNPWTFTELVAGHTYMLLAYGATIWILAETLREKPRPLVLIGAMLLTAQQVQFLLIDTLVLAVLTWRTRQPAPLLIALAVWVPAAIGIAGERHSLLSIPFTLAWERNQSVPPLGALLLDGYFARYGAQFSAWHCGPMSGVALLALAGFALRARRRSVPALAATLAIAALLVAMGTRGPLAIPYAWAVSHATFVAVFRELYDLLAFTVIGYVIAASSLRVRAAGAAFLTFALALTALWWLPPPSRWWVPSSHLPNLEIRAPANTRFALLPAFQPLSLEGTGSGADPDLYGRAVDVAPLNQYVATYPADAALGGFLASGDTSALRALSVSVVIERPWLRASEQALAQQWAFGDRILPWRSPAAQTFALQPLPELSLIAAPAVGTLDDQLGSGNVFYGDLAAHPAFVAVVAANTHVDAASGWVDARLAFAQRPDLAQGLGGALTTNPNAWLALQPNLEALVWVDGVLRARDGTVVTRATHGYRWISLPRDAVAVACSGLCVVAAQGMPPRAPLNPPPRPYRALAFTAVTPWLVRATLPPGDAGAVRYNVAYDGAWAASIGGHALPHLRLDTTVNGWLVPARTGATDLLIVERVAAAQALAELAVCVLLAVLGIRLSRRRQWR